MKKNNGKKVGLHLKSIPMPVENKLPFSGQNLFLKFGSGGRKLRPNMRFLNALLRNRERDIGNFVMNQKPEGKKIDFLPIPFEINIIETMYQKLLKEAKLPPKL